MMKPINYICRHCGTTNTIKTFWRWFFTPHFGSKKWIKCKECERHSLMTRMDWEGPKWLDWYK